MPVKRKKSYAYIAIWRQRGSDSEVLVVVLYLIILGDNSIGIESEKIAENKYFWSFSSGRKLAEKSTYIPHSIFHII